MAGSSTHDVLIAGGGPTGASAAIVLARAGWRVCLLNRSSTPPVSCAVVRTGETLPGASRATLRMLGVWSTFLRDRHLPSPGSVAWWDSEQPNEQDGVFNPSGPAWHVDRPRFDLRLREAAAMAGAEVLDGVRLADAQLVAAPTSGANACWTAALAGGEHTFDCAARFLIVATGRARPPVLRGVARRRLDSLMGLAALVPGCVKIASVDQRIWIEATPEGWWYTAPTPSGAWTVTFFTDADRVPRRDGRAAVTRYWQRQLAQSTHTRSRVADLELSEAALADATEPGSLQLIAADSYRQVPCHGPGWLAAGDTASAWDPLSGQGVEKALQSGLRVGRAVDSILRGGDAAAICAAYGRQEAALHRQYRRYRCAYYAQVRRWPEAVFWQRRTRGRGSPVNRTGVQVTATAPERRRPNPRDV